MATTTHNLKIKAVLDTSEIRSQLNGIRESNAVGSGVNSSLDLNNAINRLIQALDKLPTNITREQKQSGGNNFNARAFASFVMGYGVNRVGNSISDLLEAKGYSQAKTAQSALTNIGTGAVAGAAFGPAGAALGASIGGLTAALDYWTSKLKESSQGIEEFNRKMSAAEGIERSQAKYLDSTYTRDFVKGALERQDIDSLNAAKGYSNQKRIQAIEQMTSLNAPDLLSRKKAAEDRLNWLQKNDSGNSEIEQLQTYIASLNVQIDKAQKALEQAQAAEQEIAAYESAIAQIEAEKQRVAEQELKTFQKAQEEAKKRVELMTSLNQAISDQLESYNIRRENRRIKELIGSGDIKAIADEKKKQDQIAKDSESKYKSLLEQAQQATTPEGKEFFLEQANEEKKIWQQAESAADSLGITLDQFQDIVAREVKNRKESLDKTKQTLKDIIKENTDQYYKAGISVGEFGKAGIQGGAKPTLGSSNLVGVRESAADISAKGGRSLFGTKDSRRLFGTNEVASDIVARNAEEKTGEAEQSYEVGYDVGQDKTEKVIDIAEVIKDLLVEMKEQQKIQTEVQRESMKQGLL